MDANGLRALQAPLKKQYREQPATALTPARAEAMLDVDRIACRVRSWGGETDAGLHPATGGDGSLACSAGMMLPLATGWTALERAPRLASRIAAVPGGPRGDGAVPAVLACLCGVADRRARHRRLLEHADDLNPHRSAFD